MSNAKVDYDLLEREYIESDISIRALAERHGVRSFSSVADQARKRRWNDKRMTFRTKRDDKYIENVAEIRAREAAEIRQEVVYTLRGIISRFAMRLADDDPDKQPYLSAKDAVLAAEKLLVLTGEVTERKEELHLGLNFSADGLPPDVLRGLADLARERRSAGGGVATALRPLAKVSGS